MRGDGGAPPVFGAASDLDPSLRHPSPQPLSHKGRGEWITASAVALLGAGCFALSALAQSGDIERGREVYSHWCAPCHAAGPGHPGTQALQAKYNGDIPAVLIEREDLSPEVVALFVRQGVSVMAPFRKTEVSDADLDALSAYLVQAHTEN